MRKEIAEQPEAIRRTLSGRLDARFQTTHLGGVEMAARELLEIRRVKILGCGSAYIAGCAGAHLIEQLARIPAHAEPASEFRYRNPVVEQDTLYIAVSQSGETFDTLAAVQEVKRKGGRVLGIVNVVGSTVARECGRGIYLHAGPEIAVVATKTFTSTVVALALLAIHLGRIRDMSTAHGARLLKALEALPAQVESILAQEPHIAALARADRRSTSDAYFVGRAAGFPVAMEGALKLKEISYLHAEAYPASELKHGPLALISPETPTVVVMPRDDLFAKNVSTIEEIRARSGPIYVVTHPGDALPVTVQRRHRSAEVRAGARCAAAEHSVAAARVSRRAGEGSQHRSAAQPREVGDRRVSTRAQSRMSLDRGGRGRLRACNRPVDLGSANPQCPDTRRDP